MTIINATKRQEHILSCLSINGGKKYDLPGLSIGKFNDYMLYFRPNPEVIHFLKEKTFLLEHHEIVLVSTNEHHVISIALDECNKALNMYININLIPEKNNNGYHWVDLEIDIKAFINEGGNFTPILVDVDEYEQKVLDPNHKAISEQEISMLMNRIFSKKFPFDPIILNQFLQHLFATELKIS